MVDRKKITYPTIRIEILDSAASILTLVAMGRDQLLIFNAIERGDYTIEDFEEIMQEASYSPLVDALVIAAGGCSKFSQKNKDLVLQFFRWWDRNN